LSENRLKQFSDDDEALLYDRFKSLMLELDSLRTLAQTQREHRTGGSVWFGNCYFRANGKEGRALPQAEKSGNYNA
jgi:hypothetical protein